MSVKLLCQQCGKEFEAKRRDARFCKLCGVIREKKRYKCFEERNRTTCPTCNKSIARRSKSCRSCDNKRRVGLHLGEKNPNWKGGQTRACGYIYVRIKPPGYKGHPYRAEHIVVWEKSNGKPLPQGWVVHHLNGIRDDNRPENLSAMPRKRHNLKLAFEPYEKRIWQLEAEISKLNPTS